MFPHTVANEVLYYSLPSRAEALSVSEKWHRAYHGTRHEALEKILQVGELAIPGERNRIDMTKQHYDPWRYPIQWLTYFQ